MLITTEKTNPELFTFPEPKKKLTLSILYLIYGNANRYNHFGKQFDIILQNAIHPLPWVQQFNS